MSEYVIGIDGGGTKTDVLCADLAGNIVGMGLSGPTNLTSNSVGAASFNLIEAVRQAVDGLKTSQEDSFQVKKLVFGLAGMDTEEEQARAFEVFSRALSHYNIGEMILLNDSWIALENGSSSADAVILISGTGSNALGRNAEGAVAKTSGMDYLLSDQGSGYDVGRQVLREAVKSFDGRSPKSVIEELVCKYFNISSIEELKSHVYNPMLSKIEVAQLAPICSEAYSQGDEVARSILEHTVEELVLMVSTVVERLGIGNRFFDLVLAGSVAKLPEVERALIDQFRASYKTVNIIVPTTPSVHGAISLAMRTSL